MKQKGRDKNKKAWKRLNYSNLEQYLKAKSGEGAMRHEKLEVLNRASTTTSDYLDDDARCTRKEAFSIGSEHGQGHTGLGEFDQKWS